MVVWCFGVMVMVPVMFEVLGVVGVIGFEVRGVVILASMGRGPQCTLDRRQKPLVVPRRKQQVVQDLLVGLALLEAATILCFISSLKRRTVNFELGFFLFIIIYLFVIWIELFCFPSSVTRRDEIFAKPTGTSVIR